MNLKNIQLFVYDFDGVLTDNCVYVNEQGQETVKVNRSDGLAISLLKKQNKNQLILSTEKNPVVTQRALKLGIECIQGSDNKLTDLKGYCKQHAIDPKNVLFIGNDSNDICLINYVGISCSPSDGYSEYRKNVNIIFNSKGGCGVVRELIDLLALDPSKTSINRKAKKYA